MQNEDELNEGLNLLGDGIRLMGVKWGEPEVERLKVVLEYASISMEFRKKVLADPRKLFDEIGIIFPKHIGVRVQEPDKNEDDLAITFTLPKYVGPA